MKIELRRLTENELELMMNWRMREDISRMLFTSPQLTIEGQKKWFAKIQNDSTQIRWIIWADDKPIGSMYADNIDYANRRCETGWFIAEKSFLSLKETVLIQQNVNQYLFENVGLNKIYGEVLDINYNTVRLIIRLVGSAKEEGRLRQHICKDGEYHDVILIGTIKEDWMQQNYKFKRIMIEDWYCRERK